MKSAFSLILLLTFSCSHQKTMRNPASEGPQTCMDAVRTVLKARKERAQVQLINSAKLKAQDWNELEEQSDVIAIIGDDLTEKRKEMALLSVAILKQEFPQESLSQIGMRFQNLKKVCTGP